MEESAIREGFARLRDGADYDRLYEAALCRAKADWLIGINGTGKSTLLRMTAGLEEPDSGTIVRGSRLDIRFLSQNPVFRPGETALEAVLRENEGRGHVWDLESQAKAMLNRLGIPDYNASVDTFSGGQKKRTALAAVLLSTADLLILD